MATHAYALETLYVDQDPDLVADTIPAVLAWVPGDTAGTARQPYRFEVEHAPASGTRQRHGIELSWDVNALERHDAGVRSRAARFRRKRTAERELITQLAGYGLAFVAISLFIKRRVVDFNVGVAPDMLFDITPGALSGVEVAARSKGGYAALRAVRDGSPPSSKAKKKEEGKKPQLLRLVDVVEAHLSLWCGTPRVSILEHVKP